MPKKEKRKFIRHLLVSPLEYQLSGQETERSETINVSEGGLLFMAKQEVSVGTLIKIQIPLYEKIFRIKAKVAHVAKDAETGLFRVGVFFSTYSDAFKVKLIEQIYLIEEYRVLRSLQMGKEIPLPEASKEWIKRYSARFQKLYW